MKKISFIVALLCASMMAFADVTPIYDTNLATLEGTSATASSENGTNTANAAIDGNGGTRWESVKRDEGTNENPNEENIAWNDDQWWLLDLGVERSFNTIKINWEGAYAKEFELLGSSDGSEWTSLYIESDLKKSGWQVIEISNTTARYIKYHGTKRATQWGHSFFEFEVYLPAKSVLTSIDLSTSSYFANVGSDITLTAQGKDQLGEPMDVAISFEVSPADAGNFAENVFTFAKLGAAEITARSGEVSSTITVYGVPGEDLALNKTSTAGIYQDANTADRANNGNPNNFWTSFNQGTSDDWWWEVDLGKSYEITNIFIHFNDCWGAYSIYSSKNESDWSLVLGNETASSNSTKYYTSLTVSGRYLKVVSAVSQIGIREFNVFASGETPVTPTPIINTDAEVKAVKMIENGQLVIIKNGVKYNVAGQQVK